MKKITIILICLILTTLAVFSQNQNTACNFDNICEYGESTGSCPSDCKTATETTTEENVFCTTEYDPVCGVDGNTYGNQCELDRAKIDFKHSGECTEQKVCITIEQQKKDCETSRGYIVEGTDWSNNCEYVRCRWDTTTTPSQCSWVEQERERCQLSGGTPREVPMPDQGSYGGPSCPMIACDYNKPNVFNTREECENSTNCICDYKMCDYVPKGTSYSEFCGKNFKPGFYCSMKKSSDGVIKCGGEQGYYCPSGYRCDNNGDWRTVGKCIKEETQHSCYEERPEEVERKKNECEKAGGELVKEKDKWGASNCENYICVSKNKTCGSVPSSLGMIMCPEGYYCEQAMNVYAGPDYKQELGKCLPIRETKTQACEVITDKAHEKVKLDCDAQRGKLELRKDSKGCDQYQCVRTSNDFCGGIAGIQCPQGFTCELKGNYPDAGGKCVPEVRVCQELSEEEIARQKIKCVNEYNGNFEIKTDAKGCTYTDCVLTNPPAQDCMSNEEVKEAVNNCVTNNGKPKVKSEQGCVKNVVCSISDKETPRVELPPEEKKDQDLGRLFNVAFKLEEIRMQFDQLKRKTASISQYYETQGDTDYSNKFKIINGLLNNAINDIDNVKSDLRNKIDKDEVNEETFNTIKQSLKNLKTNLKELLKELLR